MNREDELQGIIDFQNKEIKEFKTILNRANVVLLNYNPDDVWFPQVKQQYSELMNDIKQILKGK